MTEASFNAARPHPDASIREEGFSLIDLLVALVDQKRILLGVPLAVGIIALIVVLFLPKWYTATAKIMPPQQSQSNAVAILGQLGVLAGGAAGQLGLKNPSDVYVTILKSRTVADNLINRFDLKRIYDEDYLVEARKELARNTSIAAGREGVITIEVEDKDPKRSAEIANAYVEELRALTVNLAVSEAAQRRLFFEGQLKKAKNDLSLAELELKKFTQDSGLVSPQGQLGLSVAAAAALRAQIAAKEIQMSSMRTFATSNNPDLKRTLEELSGLRAELAKMEKDSTAGKGDVMVPFGKAPEVGLDYLRKYRDVKYHETLYEVLAKQYEIARIDEAKDATLIQVLDVAVPPERRSKPQRTLIIVTSVFLAAVLAIVWVLIATIFARARMNPAIDEKIRVLKGLATRF